MSRGKSPSIYRNSDSDLREDLYMRALEDNLSKEAVQSRAKDQSIFEQINSIMNVKSQFSSVQAAVEDMRQRSGLVAFLKTKVSEDQVENIKTAEDSSEPTQQDQTPDIFKKIPDIRNTLENYITSTKGNMPVPAVIYKLKAIHNKDVADLKDWDDMKLMKLISDLSLEEKQKNPNIFTTHHNLGKVEPLSSSDINESNMDAFISLNPAKL